MSVAKIIEISSESPKSFDEAIKEGIARASRPSTTSSRPG